MQRYSAHSLVIMAILSAFWAYVVAVSLLTEFAGSVTWIDLGVLFILGAISGAGLAAAFMVTRVQRR